MCFFPDCPSSEMFNLPLDTYSSGYCHRFSFMDHLQLIRSQSADSELGVVWEEGVRIWHLKYDPSCWLSQLVVRDADDKVLPALGM